MSTLWRKILPGTRPVRQMLQDPRWEVMGAFKVIAGLVRSGQARDMFWRQRWQSLLMEWMQIAGGRWESVARKRVGVPGTEPENLEEWSVICWDGENDDERRGAGLWRKNKEFVCTHSVWQFQGDQVEIPKRPPDLQQCLQIMGGAWFANHLHTGGRYFEQEGRMSSLNRSY